ncbi:uncharacterized protein LOC128242674 isoform X2 [Mya arenaria]|uniref:uncharacterized protein LOC128242674 isoform X2 n=1 Tax=Mya arenaria TaxID=6604 RepID=UPI0022E7B08C|nr:uncharacterized protein LOC128242674 isoform X2 [Mya arenaria]
MKELVFDAQKFFLKSVTSLIDDSWLRLEYDGDLLKSLNHSNGNSLKIRYNSINYIHSMQLLNSNNEQGSSVEYFYNFKTNMLSQMRSEGNVVRYFYNNNDNSLRMVIKTKTSSREQFRYNAYGHLISRKLIKGGRIITDDEYTFTKGGMTVIDDKTISALTNVIYSESNDVISVQKENGVPVKTLRTSAYESIYEGERLVSNRAFDGNTVFITDGNGDTIKTKFNDLGQMIQFADGKRNVYEIIFNDNQTIKEVLYPDGTNKIYSYFKNGHYTKMPSGNLKRYEFNSKGLLTKKDIGSDTITMYEYTEDGKLNYAANELGETSIEYDGNLPKAIKSPETKISYEYNRLNQLTRISTDQGYDTQYQYDGQGRITEVSNGKTTLVKTTYNDAGLVTRKDYGNSAYSVFVYKSSSRLLLSLMNFYPNKTMASFFNYTYARSKMRIQMTTMEGSWKFKYDRAGQMTSMIDPMGNETLINYDKAKNRRSVNRNEIEEVYNVNEMNQYKHVGEVSFEYDRNGNLKTRQSSKNETFGYDEDNKLVSYSSRGKSCKFEYDAFGNLVSKLCDGNQTKYITSPLGFFDRHILEQISSSGKRTRFYYGGPDIGLIAAETNEETMQYFFYDHLGTVVNILSENGELLSSYNHDPFGNVLSPPGSKYPIFTFIGQWGVVDIQEIQGVFYMQSRMYDSSTGRFLSPDGLGLKAKSQNLYIYCGNNPVHFNDPKGTCPFCFYIAFEGAVGVGKYLFSTPVNQWTFGGATGSLVEGSINGVVGKYVKVPFVKDLASVATKTLGNYVQHTIDGEKYDWKDARDDILKGFIDMADAGLAKKFEKYGLFKEICSEFEDYKSKTIEICHLSFLVDVDSKHILELADGFVDWVASHDPNDMIGPSGFGAARFISGRNRMTYTIRFENDENATAPAQRVYVEHSYSEFLDDRTFTIGKFGFGEFEQPVKDNSKSFQGTINMTSTSGVYVKIFCGIDVVRRVLFWNFQSIDPATGFAPSDPSVGFLPPNNDTTGQGFVTFTVVPLKEAPDTTTINANASIYFDQNDPIDTPNVFNTIDKSTPTVNGSVVPRTESAESSIIRLRSEDDGSGVKQVDLYRLENGTFSLFAQGIREEMVLISVNVGESMFLLPVPIDNVGNSLALLEINETATILVSSKLEKHCNCSGNGSCSIGLSTCICNDGFYGPNCISTTPPLEPPSLSLRGSSGFVDEPLQITVDAKNISGSLEQLQIAVVGFPSDTLFEDGLQNIDGVLCLYSSQFGTLNITFKRAGEINLNVTVHQSDINMTRFGQMTVLIYPTISANLAFEGCLNAAERDTAIIAFNISAKVLQESQNAADKLSLQGIGLVKYQREVILEVKPAIMNNSSDFKQIKEYSFDGYETDGNIPSPVPYGDSVEVLITLLVTIDDIIAKEFDLRQEVNRVCNATPPLEPPSLSLRGSSGFVNEPLQITVDAKNISGSLEQLHIAVSGFPSETLFEDGLQNIDGVLCLNSSQFGTLNITFKRAGEINLNVTVLQSDINMTRFGQMTVLIYPTISANLAFEGCLNAAERDTAIIAFNISAKVLQESQNAADKLNLQEIGLVKYQREVQIEVKPAIMNNTYDIQQIKEYSFDGYVTGGNIPSPVPYGDSVEVRITLLITINDTLAKEFYLQQEVNRVCHGCTHCVTNHTAYCDNFDGVCHCKPAWNGSVCSDDVDECVDIGVCDAVPNTGCFNLDGGYECSCFRNFVKENDSCILTTQQFWTDITTAKPTGEGEADISAILESGWFPTGDISTSATRPPEKQT